MGDSPAPNDDGQTPDPPPPPAVAPSPYAPFPAPSPYPPPDAPPPYAPYPPPAVAPSPYAPFPPYPGAPSPHPPYPPYPQYPPPPYPMADAAPMLEVIDRDVRRGELVAAANAVATVPPWAEASLDALLDALDADGLRSEVRLLRDCLRDRWAPSVVNRSRLVGTVVTFIVAVCLGVVAGLLAILPALAATMVAREVTFAVLVRTVPGRNEPFGPPVAVARTLADLTFYRSPALRMSMTGIGLFAGLGGLAVVAGIGIGIAGYAPIGAFVLGLTGLTTIGSAILAAAGTRRLAHAQLGATRPVAPRGPTVTSVLGPVPVLDQALVIDRPRMVVSVMTAAVAAGFLLIGATGRDPALLVAGILAGVVAGALWQRQRRTRVVIGPDGIEDVGLLRTRRYRWDEVHALLVGDEERTNLVLVEAGGRRRELVPHGRMSSQQLTTIAERTVGLASAADPGPDPADGCLQVAFVIVLSLTALLTTAILLAVVLAGSPTSVNPANLPPGRVFWTYPRADGTRYYTVDCPSLLSWVGGDRDPLCAGQTRTAAMASAVSFTIDVVLVVAIVALLRNRHRRRRARAPAGAP